jgi:hypothetical protein
MDVRESLGGAGRAQKNYRLGENKPTSLEEKASEKKNDESQRRRDERRQIGTS